MPKRFIISFQRSAEQDFCAAILILSLTTDFLFPSPNLTSSDVRLSKSLTGTKLSQRASLPNILKYSRTHRAKKGLSAALPTLTVYPKIGIISNRSSCRWETSKRLKNRSESVSKCREGFFQMMKRFSKS